MDKYKLIISSFGKDRFKFNEDIKNHTVLNIGGPAEVFFIAFTTNELVKIINMCWELELSFFLLGTGSKVMLSDYGYSGLVIKNRTKNIQTISVKGKVTKYGIGVEEALIEVDSGVSLNKFAQYLESQNLVSDGFLELPGSIGGNLFMNAFLQNKAKSIKVLTQSEDIEQILPHNLALKKHIILSAVFKIRAKV